MYGYCKYEFNCKFAHGHNELHEKSVPFKEKYKTKGCVTFTSQGFCPYGSRCLFMHTEEYDPEDPKRRGPYRKALESFMEGKRLAQPKVRIAAVEKALFYLPVHSFASSAFDEFSVMKSRFESEIRKIEEIIEYNEDSELKVSLDFLE